MLPSSLAAGLRHTVEPVVRIYEVICLTGEGAVFANVRSAEDLGPGATVELESGSWHVERLDEVEGGLIVRLWCSPARQEPSDASG